MLGGSWGYRSEFISLSVCVLLQLVRRFVVDPRPHIFHRLDRGYRTVGNTHEPLPQFP